MKWLNYSFVNFKIVIYFFILFVTSKKKLLTLQIFKTVQSTTLPRTYPITKCRKGDSADPYYSHRTLCG